MKILAPEEITHGVEDMDTARRFRIDFGLDPKTRTPESRA